MSLDTLTSELEATTLVGNLTIASRRLQVAVDQSDTEFSAAWRQVVDATAAGNEWLTTDPDLDPDLHRRLCRLFSKQTTALGAVSLVFRRPQPAPDDLARLVDEIDESMAYVADALDQIGEHLPVLIG